MKLQRYDWNKGMGVSFKADDGDWVDCDDVKQLEDELDTAKDEIKRLTGPITCATPKCDTVIYHQAYCSRCKKQWES